MINNIYFVQNFHSIKPFLSLIEPGKTNLIVMSNQESVSKFLQDIMPNERKLIVPAIGNTTFGPLFSNRRNLYKLLIDILFYRIYYTRVLRKISISASSTAYFFAIGDINLLILVNYLFRKGVKIVFIDGIRSKELFSVIDNSELSLFHQSYLCILSLLSGIRLSWFRHLQKRKYKVLGWSECVEQIPYKSDSWESIARKFNWQLKIDTRNAVLLVDTPMQNMTGINVDKTQHNLVKYFTGFLDKGKNIHVKQYFSSPGKHSFQGTCLEDKVKTLPDYYPAEIILNYYREIYLFGSHTGSTPCKGKKYSLAKMLVFNSKERHDIYWSGCKYSFGEEMDKIEFVEIDE